MLENRFLTIYIAFLGLIGSGLISSCESSTFNGLEMLSIHEIKKQEPGFYGLEGFAIEINDCPPCPPLQGCEPCARNNSIVVSNDSQGVSAARPAENEILLHTKNAGSFERGKKYRLKVRVTGNIIDSGPDRGIERVEIVAFRPLKTP